MSPSQRDGVLATGHAQSFLAVAIVFPILATSFVIARLYCRRLTRLTLGVEDWLVLAALVSQMQSRNREMLKQTDILLLPNRRRALW